MDIFEWREDHIKIINDITTILNYGKGLEQSIEAAREVGEKLYILKTLSYTRFSAYFEKSIGNVEKRIETTITTLKIELKARIKKSEKKPSISILSIVESNLTCLCKHLGKQLVNRLTENSIPSLIIILGIFCPMAYLEDNKMTDEMKK